MDIQIDRWRKIGGIRWTFIPTLVRRTDLSMKASSLVGDSGSTHVRVSTFIKFPGWQEMESLTHLSGAASHCLRAIHSNSWCRMFCTRPTGHDVEALFEYLFSVSRHLLRRPKASGKFYKGERVRLISLLQQPRISKNYSAYNKSRIATR